MFPHERSLVQKFADKPFALIGVNSDRDLARMRAKYAHLEITWRNFWAGPEGPNGPIVTSWYVSGHPTLFLIDHTGVIRHKWVGNPGDEVLDAAVEVLVTAVGAAAK